ncbi:MAG TPA: hypothetical protein VGQ42_00200 [Candidatus Dormibacteraeota bacterium]|jgi:hypothetical protein|nr:hypothetical protein [Candidatus Dormibacteraeota bacterium]
MTDLTIVDSAGRAGEAALDTIVGGASFALDAVARPGRSTGRARRRGSAVNNSITDGVEEVVDEVVSLPERALIAYIRMLRRTGRRPDVVGAVTRTLLDVVNGPAKEAARFFERLERETETGTRRRGGRRASTATRARRTTRATAASARGTASRVKSAAKGTARRTATAGRRTTATAARRTTTGSGRGRGRSTARRRSA